MKIGWKNIAIAALLIICIVLFWWLMNEKNINTLKERTIRRLTDENDEIRKAYLDLLQRFMLLHNDANPDILKELEKLKELTVNLDREIHLAIDKVISLINDGHYEVAIRDLGKIIENILKAKIKEDATFKKKHDLKHYLEHAKECKWIRTHEHAFAELIRIIRNEDSHELNVKIEPHQFGLAVFAGVEIIYSLNSL